MKIGDRIRTARTKAGLTQRALASLLGVDKSAVAQWEGGGGYRGGIKPANLLELARVLGIRPSVLFGEPTQEDQLVLHDSDEITVITLYRKLPKKLRDVHRQLLFVQTDSGEVAERVGDQIERREVAS